MPRPPKLSPAELAAALATVPTWSLDATGALARSFRFATFADAFAFMTRVAFHAERLKAAQ